MTQISDYLPIITIILGYLYFQNYGGWGVGEGILLKEDVKVLCATLVAYLFQMPLPTLL